MTLSEISIRNPVFAWMLMIALMFFGWIGFSRMGVSQTPDVDFPVVNVTLTFEGASPEIMETEVVDVVEDAVMSIQGIREVNSTARQESASITIEFELDRNIDAALQEVQTKLAQAQRRLPSQMDPPVIVKVNPEDHPIMWVGLSGDNKTLRQLVDYADDHVKPFLQTVSGVGEVFLGGFLDRNLRVWLDAKKMADREITVQDVLDAISGQHFEAPAGRMETPDKELNVRLLGEATTPEQFGNIVIATRSGRPIYRPFRLREVARIEDGLSDVRRIARINGRLSLGLGILKQRGSNAVAVADGIRSRLVDLERTMPKDLHIGVNFDSTRFIRDSIAELNITLVLSALLTSLVCWLFLGSWSSTLNVLLAIPTSILGTFLVLYFLGATLNTFTLLGLTLAIGIVVDDAIMVLENITRHGEMRKSRIQAALDGSNEITFAAIAATVAIIAIFLPVAFMSGVVGKFFFFFGVTISVAVALSLLEALTLTPMRCSQFLSVGERKGRMTRAADAAFHGVQRVYLSTLNSTLRWKGVALVGSLLLFVGSLYLVRTLRREFLPSQDMSMLLVRMQAPIGSSIDYTDRKFRQAEAFIQARPEIERYFAAIGGFGGGEVDTGVLFLTLKQPNERTLTQNQFMDVVRTKLNDIGGIKAFVQDLSTSGFTAQRGFPIEFTLRGPDFDKLGELSSSFAKAMEKTELYQDIDTDYRIGMPEVEVLPDRVKASERGVSIDDIGKVVGAAIGGVRAGKYTKGGRRYDIRVRLETGDRLEANDIRNLYVRNNRGEVVSLAEVVQIRQRETVQTISRRDRMRAVSIFSNIREGVSQADAVQKVEKMGKDLLPEGYQIVFTGGTKAFEESFQGLLLVLWLGIVAAYMVLGSQFNSFIHPLTVLLALPFSVTGGLLALWMTGNSLNIYSFIGLLLLMGIVKKNSILLVDFANQARQRGLAVREALVEAGQNRLRPILMTSLSTIAAAIPPALALGPGAETRVPMALTVIGGVAVSTLLTLYVVPCAYEIFASRHKRSAKRKAA